jgi:Suppressor of fused protein (SUFU)
MTDESWKKIWDARKAALEAELGPADDLVLHAFKPFHLGGQADVLTFHKHIPGRVAVTCELLGEPSQKKNVLGNFELMICHRNENDWGAKMISRLARFTCERVLNSGDTMDIGPAVPQGSTIAGLFFAAYSQFKFADADAGILLCIGVTTDELAACRQRRQQEVYDALKEAGVLPYTDLNRESSLPNV